MMRVEEKANIVLCGFMATGKSSVGKMLAKRMNYEFLDMDAAIEKEEGTSVAQIFASRGEPAFRAMETRMVERLAASQGLIIATGGGTIVNPKNLEKLKSCGVVITLTADIPTILQRAGSGEDRPLLQAEDRVERIKALLAQRATAYAQADIILDTSSLTIDEVTQQIIGKLKEFRFPLPAGE
jgi:shikimate kinase